MLAGGEREPEPGAEREAGWGREPVHELTIWSMSSAATSRTERMPSPIGDLESSCSSSSSSSSSSRDPSSIERRECSAGRGSSEPRPSTACDILFMSPGRFLAEDIVGEPGALESRLQL